MQIYIDLSFKFYQVKIQLEKRIILVTTISIKISLIYILYLIIYYIFKIKKYLKQFSFLVKYIK